MAVTEEHQGTTTAADALSGGARPEPPVRTPDVAIIGGGISGIGAAIKIREAGLGEVLILERAGELGGTWRDNTYPGCACDVPSSLYSFSFAPNPEWTRIFAHQPEIQAYVLDIADRHHVRDVTSFATEVVDARWDAARQRWVIDTTTGRVVARFLVIAAGPLHEPVYPDVPGIERFTGPAFHSSRWQHDLDLAGRRVAVVGTGASACQFVPEIQPVVGSLTLFQRTPAWVIPKPDWKIGHLERRVLRRFPGLQRLRRAFVWSILDVAIFGAQKAGRARRWGNPLGRWNIARAIEDPDLRFALTPTYVLGCKRPLLSNTYYPALVKPNVTVVPHGLREVREHSVVDARGVEHEVDTIIYGTGFHVTDLPIAQRIHGADGRSLAEVWDGSPEAYLGTSISGYPNAFMLFGPNVGTTSAFTMLDAQLGFVTDALTRMRDQGLASVDVRPEVQEAYNRKVRKAMEGSVWTAGGCTSYYLDQRGRNASAWPWTMTTLRRRLRRFPLADYRTTPAESVPDESPAEVGAGARTP